MMTEEINWPYCREAFANYLRNSVLTADETVAPAVNEISLPESGESSAPAADEQAPAAVDSGFLVVDDD